MSADRAIMLTDDQTRQDIHEASRLVKLVVAIAFLVVLVGGIAFGAHEVSASLSDTAADSSAQLRSLGY